MSVNTANLSARNAAAIAARDTSKRPDGWYGPQPERAEQPPRAAPKLQRAYVRRPPKARTFGGPVWQHLLATLVYLARRGEALPGNTELAQIAGMSLAEAKGALETLLSSGRIQRHHTGQGWRVLWLRDADLDLRSADAPADATARRP